MSEINVKYGGESGSVPGGSTVFDAIKQFDRDASKKALAAKVNGEEYDLGRELPVNGDLEIEAIVPDTRDGLEVLRHSTAHLLAAAVLDLYPGTKLGIGPALLDDPRYGFFYDVITPEPLSVDDLPQIEKRMLQMAKRNLKYRREDVSKAKILDIFEDRKEPLKCELIDEKVEGEASIYYIDDSPFIDFCLGPHVPHTGKLKAFKLLAIAGAYWKGDAEREQMQRIYGTAFFTKEELDSWLKQREEAAKRDHRKLAQELDLFSIQEDYGQGLILWHAKGGIVRMEMENYLKEKLSDYGYSFVYTPHIAKRDLWKISGHEDNYADSMYSPTSIEDVEYRLKPMNCPLHIGIYKSSMRSYRDLPQRYSEMGTVYRAELSGTLHGLMRVRGFTVDDAHLFVRPDQVLKEVGDCLDFAIEVFETFGFDKVIFELSVRGEAENKKFLGKDKDWEQAEESLAAALNERKIEFERIEGEAAFYGPKIDIQIEDAIGRTWQLGTIQVDFNLPERFGLEYIGEDNSPHRPYMIHRALFGSIERFFGVMLEHFGGALPLWLAPVQVAVLPITDRINDYAEEVASKLKNAGIRVEANLRSDKIGAKIREAQLQKVPFMLIVGDQEKESGLVAVRERAKGDLGTMETDEFVGRVSSLKAIRAIANDHF
ncbi:MAG: threonine--tRNA ligase [Acidobacteria bacterium]|nr:MAG: threonine--tRNA ligase [Acidobacteriota bacterium]REK01600.1 MAG: threonine--tRNA ligase [Acidobacteriota bacterium]REK14556.1 MAG: threonine--tRNA ligase [Acidobacteriota bacterium]REK45271.1 MAG: threonine--tRNA ligase [Acidobacteriota bacterium]